jgi:hypothetical protein
LNACESEGHADVLSEGVDFTIGHRALLGDDDAINFSGDFYVNLFKGRSLLESFIHAKSRSMCSRGGYQRFRKNDYDIFPNSSKGHRLYFPKKDPRKFYLVKQIGTGQISAFAGKFFIRTFTSGCIAGLFLLFLLVQRNKFIRFMISPRMRVFLAFGGLAGLCLWVKLLYDRLHKQRKDEKRDCRPATIQNEASVQQMVEPEVAGSCLAKRDGLETPEGVSRTPPSSTRTEQV